jgi:hypothetical protein
LCCSHTVELSCKHAVENCYQLNAEIENILKVLVRARGNKSSKRRKILEKRCKEAEIGFLAIFLSGATRWGNRVISITGFLRILPAFELYEDIDIPTTRDEQTPFSSLLQDAILYLDLVKACMPILNVLFEWTQILTVASSPTIGLVLLSVNRFKAALRHLLSLSTVDGVK